MSAHSRQIPFPLVYEFSVMGKKVWGKTLTYIEPFSQPETSLHDITNIKNKKNNYFQRTKSVLCEELINGPKHQELSD